MTDPYSELPPDLTLPDAEKQALDTSQYKEGASAIDTQATQDTADLGLQREGTVLSYKQQRQDTINSFQDALDAINESVKAVGIQTRAGASQRNLYNASGEYSGIGTNVAGQAIQPYTAQIGKLGERQGQQLTDIGGKETLALQGIDAKINALPNTANQEKMKLKQGIVESIINLSDKNRKAALERINEQIDNGLAQDKFTYQKETEAQKIAAKPRQDQLKNRTELQAKGYKYVATPKELTKLKKRGVPLVNVGKDWFVVSKADQLKLKQQQATLNKTKKVAKGGGGGGGGNTKTKIIPPPKFNEIYSENTTPFKNFIKDIQETAGMNIDPNKSNALYNNYQEAQQAIDQDPSKFSEIIKNPNASLFKHLLKAKKVSSSSSDEPPPLFNVPE